MDIRNQIVSILCEKEHFSREDVLKIKVEKQFEDKRDSLVSATLDLLVSEGLLLKVGLENDLWMLAQPIGKLGQEIHIPMELGAVMAETINMYLRANGATEDICDPLNLSAQDIGMLLKMTVESLNQESTRKD